MERWFKTTKARRLSAGLLLLSLAMTSNIDGQRAQSGQNRHDIYVGTNNGSITQNNNILISPQVLKQLKRLSPGNEPYDNVLTPAKEIAPPLSGSCPKDIERGHFRVILAGYGDVICPAHYCEIIKAMNEDPRDPISGTLHPGVESSELLSVRVVGKSMRIHAEVFGSNGQIEAVVEDNNRIVRNQNNTFDWQRPDASTLIFKSTDNRPAIKIRFVNPSTLYVEGVFYDRYGRWLRLPGPDQPNAPNFGNNMHVRDTCTYNDGGIAF